MGSKRTSRPRVGAAVRLTLTVLMALTASLCVHAKVTSDGHTGTTAQSSVTAHTSATALASSALTQDDSSTRCWKKRAYVPNAASRASGGDTGQGPAATTQRSGCPPPAVPVRGQPREAGPAPPLLDLSRLSVLRI
jgi:hypothetical protein